MAGFANGLSVICDVAIALGLCYYFQTGKSGFSSCARLSRLVSCMTLSPSPAQIPWWIGSCDMLYSAERSLRTYPCYLPCRDAYSLVLIRSISQFMHMITVRTVLTAYTPLLTQLHRLSQCPAASYFSRSRSCKENVGRICGDIIDT